MLQLNSKLVRRKIELLTEHHLRPCVLRLERRWSGLKWWLTFTDEDGGDTLEFDTLKQVYEWLVEFDNACRSRADVGIYDLYGIPGTHVNLLRTPIDSLIGSLAMKDTHYYFPRAKKARRRIVEVSDFSDIPF